MSHIPLAVVKVTTIMVPVAYEQKLDAYSRLLTKARDSHECVQQPPTSSCPSCSAQSYFKES